MDSNFVALVHDPSQAQLGEMEDSLTTVQTENNKIKDALEKEQQAAIEAEEACTKLEGMKGKLEDEIAALLEQIDEEQDNNFKISAQKRALDAELSEIKGNMDILESNVKSVRDALCLKITAV